MVRLRLAAAAWVWHVHPERSCLKFKSIMRIGKLGVPGALGPKVSGECGGAFGVLEIEVTHRSRVMIGVDGGVLRVQHLNRRHIGGRLSAIRKPSKMLARPPVSHEVHCGFPQRAFVMHVLRLQRLVQPTRSFEAYKA